MFIAHYKSVNSPKEFYSEKRNSLDFPTQVELLSERYLLASTIQIATSKQEEGLYEVAKKNDIKTNVKVS